MTEVNSAEAPVTRRPWLVLGIFCAGFFMALLDGTIVNIAVPTLISSVDASYNQVLWVLDAYLLVFTVLLITTGRLGDIFGYRRMFLIGITLFTVASGLCGLADTGAQLLAARVLQAVGTALLFPQVISAILTIFPGNMRGRAFGLFGAIAGLAPVAGPIVGGFILAKLSWPWIFFINIPIGVITIILTLIYAPPMRSAGTRSLDLVGVALATAGLTGIVFGLIEGERYDWGTTIGSIIVAGIVLLALFVLWETREKSEPLIPMALFTARNFSIGNGVGFIFYVGMMAIPLVMVLHLQTARGHTPLDTGLLLLPGAVITAFGSAYSGRLSDKFGGKYILMAGLAMLAAGLLVLTLTTAPNSSTWSLLPGLIIIGFGNGATYAPLQQVTMDGVNPQLAGAASGVANTIRQIGSVVGLAVLGALLSTRLTAALQTNATQQAAQLPPHLREKFMTAITRAAEHFSPPTPPPGLSTTEAALFQRLGNEAFTTSFTGAIHTTLLATAAILIAATTFCALLPKQQPEATPDRAKKVAGSSSSDIHAES
ncbi:MFS transporter [Nonomuraea endophytica]|uniref:EmrB/QacA subfamily drug resistance transporter n=1 Tax=Nonomuraea endophytica TaxID=714136 RepID=A0A7W8AAZ5_9ACTN|nr:MFS transporter [Nonomuraea endophytica]MBB5082874.1 EmrB/QacA subfamily drug resistance transporter [Nonomuraea endophytica]